MRITKDSIIRLIKSRYGKGFVIGLAGFAAVVLFDGLPLTQTQIIYGLFDSGSTASILLYILKW